MVRFVVGIDLGTSNCALASVEVARGAAAPIVDLAVPQLVRPGELTGRALYPSVVYLPFPGEFPEGSLALPWASQPAVITGEFARWQGSRVPGRVIASAKSWLIHPGVDRQAPILPWGAPDEVPRRSPVAALAELLGHLKASWDQAHADAPLHEQEVVLTIPASFDEAARALTLQAARDAGYPLGRLTLLEEPSAAFYDFTARHRTRLAQALAQVRLVLVVDVGGGTTDFSLVQVAMLPEGPALRRIAVGDHLLLGGDNMDAALARVLEHKTLGAQGRFTAAQWAHAVQAARGAKETLLGSSAAGSVRVSIAGAGARLVGGTLSAELTREDVETTVVGGFFPPAAPQGAPEGAARRGAVVELGLPYAKDPAITRHLVAFLEAHATAGHQALEPAAASDGPGGAQRLPRPDAVLLNGGVFNSPVLTKALVERLSALWPEQPPVKQLEHESLDLAVARGAAYSGLARRALGQKIGGGAPRAFYVVVADGADGAKKGVCLVPRGLEEGATVELTERTLTLTVGRPVQFQLVSTTADRLDRAGDVVTLDEAHFQPLPPIHTILKAAQPPASGAPKGPAQPEPSPRSPAAGTRNTVSVHLVASLSEVGTLALSCVAGQEQRWRLEFELRGAARTTEVTVTESMPARFGEATTEVERVFGTRPLPVEPKDVKNLFRTLERLLGPREGWTVPVLREMWTTVWAGASKRRRSPDHEKVMYQLLGFTLRPGSGYPLDGWRCEQTFTIFKDLVTNHGEQAIWAEFWVLWRRVAGGLGEAAQRQLWTTLEPHLARRVPLGVPPPKEKLKGVQPQALEEMVRLAASLELLDPSAKRALGDWVRSRLTARETSGGPWAWALGRLGAREPVQGATHRVVAPEVAAEWIDVLLGLDPKQHDGAAFALAQLARKTGDRSREIDEERRAQVLARLAQAKAPASWTTMVEAVVQLSAADEARALGDTLPVGLTL